MLGEARTVLMTGPRRSEVAVGLAAAAAAVGTRTALLECDLAEPALADALGLARAPGLHEYLLGTVAPGEILKPVVLAGPGSAAAREPLICVVAGRPAADAPELLVSERCRQAIERLRSGYELVVIDGPSLDGEAALETLVEWSDTTIACIDPAGPRRLAVSVAGLVIQN